MTGGASAKQDEGIFFLCGPDQVVNIYGKKVAALVEGKGGGKTRANRNGFASNKEYSSCGGPRKIGDYEVANGSNRAAP